MAITTEQFSYINVGGSPNDGTGDNLRGAFVRVNQNYSNIETVGFNTGNISAAGTVLCDTALAYNLVQIGNTAPQPFPSALINAITSVDTYSQFNIQNTLTTGTNTSADVIVTGDKGSDTTFYVDLGMIGSNYDTSSPTNSLGTCIQKSDGYLYVQGNVSTEQGGNLIIGTTTQDRYINFIAGGISSANVVAKFAPKAITLSANLSLADLGNPATSSSTGTVGQIAFDSGNIYICVAANTWKRAALSTF